MSMLYCWMHAYHFLQLNLLICLSNLDFILWVNRALGFCSNLLSWLPLAIYAKLLWHTIMVLIIHHTLDMHRYIWFPRPSMFHSFSFQAKAVYRSKYLKMSSTNKILVQSTKNYWIKKTPLIWPHWESLFFARVYSKMKKGCTSKCPYLKHWDLLANRVIISSKNAITKKKVFSKK